MRAATAGNLQSIARERDHAGALTQTLCGAVLRRCADFCIDRHIRTGRRSADETTEVLHRKERRAVDAAIWGMLIISLDAMR